MADLDIAIAGRSYRVACEDGQETNLARAAQLVSEEAETLREQFGTQFAALPESRVLLMAALMLGDRFRAHLAEAPAAAPQAAPEAGAPQQPGFFEDPAQAARIAELEAELADAREAEAAALAALDDAAARVREMASEMREGAAEEEEALDEDPGLEPDADGPEARA
jgi:cell division protein ZapA